MKKEETRLRELAREALKKGRLPNYRPRRMWGGPGCGVPCAVCGLPIDASQTELELDFSGEGSEQDNHHLHQYCFAAWEFERKNGAADRAAPGHKSDARHGADSGADSSNNGNGDGGLALPVPNLVGMIAVRDHETSP